MRQPVLQGVHPCFKVAGLCFADQYFFGWRGQDIYMQPPIEIMLHIFYCLPAYQELPVGPVEFPGIQQIT